MRVLEGIAHDFRVAIRSLTKEAGFTAVTAATLSLGIGSATAVFGLFNQLVLRPLPGVPNSSSAAYLAFDTPLDTDTPEFNRLNRGMAIAEFDELRRQATLLDGLASHRPLSGAASAGNSSSIEVFGRWIYGDYFEILGAAPASGRLLSAEDNALGSDPTVAVVSERLAATLFPGNPDAVGSTFALNGRPLTIIGIIGGGFAGHERSNLPDDVWLPLPSYVHLNELPSDEDLRSDAPSHRNFLIRPSPGVTLEAVDAQLRAVLTAMAPTSSRSLNLFIPRISSGLSVSPSAQDRTAASIRIMAAAALLLLLAACANAANLLLVRNLLRGTNAAVRRAVGATSERVARLLVTESLLLGCAGAVGGAGTAWLVTLVFRGQNLTGLPELAGFALDWRVLAFLVAAALGTTFVFGVAPSVVGSRLELRSVVEARSGPSARQSVTRSALTAAQIGLTLSILVGALLMARTLDRLYSLDTGLDLTGVAALNFTHPPGLSHEEVVDRQQRLIAAVLEVPGIDEAASSGNGPHRGGLGAGVLRGPADSSGPLGTEWWVVTDRFIELIDLALLRGEVDPLFERTEGGPQSVLLTASLARRLFGDSEAIGQPLFLGPQRELRVVGVVEDYRSHRSPDAPTDVLLMDYAQGAPGYLNMTLLVKATQFTPEVTGAVRDAFTSIFPEVPVPNLVSYEEQIDAIHAERRVFRNLFVILSGLALALSVVGLYGVISYSVASRTKELGVRSALGAGRSELLGLAFAYGGKMVLAGAILGVGLAYAIGRLLEARLFGVVPLDPVSFVLAMGLVVMLGIAASWLPARRAAAIDPAVAIRTG
jgi:predicted permease